MDGISNAASLVALLQLAGAVINYLSTVIDAPAQKRKLLAALIQARGLLSTLVELTNEVQDEDWSHTIQSLSAHNGPLPTFQELLEHMARKLGITHSGARTKTVLDQLRWPFDQTGFQEMITSLEKLKSHFLLAMANDHIRLSKAIRSELHELQNQLTEATFRTQRQTIMSLSKEQELIVKSLSLGGLFHELNGDEVMERRAGAEWFLRQNAFKKWHGTSHTPSTLVLTGSPGSGKSSICEVTRFFLKAWHQSEIDTCVAYFAFNFSQREKLSEALVLSNIVQQILLERPYLMEHIAALRVTGGPLSSIESIDLIRRARRDLKYFYVILDGLDECEGTSRNVVESLLQIKPPVNILAAGRGTSAAFGSLQDSVIVHADDAMTLSAHFDMIKKMLEKNARLTAYLDHSPETVTKAANLIFEQSNGSWISATTMIESLAQSETRATFERLLNDAPLNLVELYELKLDDVVHQPTELAVLAKKALGIVLDANGSVTVSKLMGALTTELTDVASAQRLGRGLTETETTETICSSCKGFLSVDEPGTRLHFVHQSVREFLVARDIS
ncbi:hypothetical protein CBS147323_10006 [Aspergillus niger]|uniref:ATP-binding protein n=1 Tax=Aspergillus lacticoffeatus (strain CBS 101883) TaxID=1450533 RepID=UPI000D7F020E|nr:uncharacterized protein BO96DRAFT_451541 [Aspergillus niger CBS 101883]KAI2953995.1 hypothetical protein CBS147323_10006 [Aspergillus niger]PYH50305.1 hypothetical protein BO96DRAFT_451541 [Aspergillus niger CBS 101883]GJP88753.1 AAA ATPase domain-containing protein [Aspergillus niger]